MKLRLRHAATLVAWACYAWALSEWSPCSLLIALAGTIPYLLVLSFWEKKQ